MCHLLPFAMSQIVFMQINTDYSVGTLIRTLTPVSMNIIFDDNEILDKFKAIVVI